MTAGGDEADHRDRDEQQSPGGVDDAVLAGDPRRGEGDREHHEDGEDGPRQVGGARRAGEVHDSVRPDCRTCRPGPGGGHATSPVDVGLHREELVDAHPTLLEAERATDEIEPPHPRALLAEQGDELVPALLERVDPVLDGTHVVLAHRLDVPHLEAGGLEMREGLCHRAHVHVGCDVGLDERAATRRGAGLPGHLLQQQPSGRLQRPVQDACVGRVLLLADVFAHLDRAHRVELGVGVDLAVVLQSHLDAIGQAAVGDPLRDQVALLGREGDSGGVHPVSLGGVQDQRTPSAADVEQPHPGSQVELPADQVELGTLGIDQRLVGPGEVRRRVGHRVIEQQLVELVGQVVVVGDRGTVAQRGVQPSGQPGLRGRRAGRQSDRTEPRRRRNLLWPVPTATVSPLCAGRERARRQARRKPSARSPSTSRSPLT